MVRVHRGTGTEIVSLSKKDVREIFELREALEVKAFELALDHLGESSIGLLEKTVEDQRKALVSGDRNAFLDADGRFHQTVARLSQNQRLVSAIDSMWDLVRRISTYTAYRHVRNEKSVDEHASMLEALKSHDPECVRTAVMRHLSKSLEEAFYVLDNRPQESA
jgi:DNA-binding GntR family transcriptional regulator